MTEERTPDRREDQKEFAEEEASLLKITLGPLIWAAHFVVCYGLVAVTCAKGWDIGAVRIGLGGLSALALAGVLWVGWAAWRQWGVTTTGDRVNRLGSAEDRHHFLGHAAFLLSIISLIGVVFVSLPLVLIGGCQ
ncbi:hypothetical protein OB2597_14294 [Pseudooceanicola batsensis HTCC2597]|uniref:Transmembrane protein n=1 Tax=Pseudooceanicola batsensis (strain ATCC BAA-863 / DSM 15984 / KCTC 12145 / HTCC2597) TaxID=252305 RepID=A3U3Z9_PSEBH|nr:hypothetical protein [Pseudooceanicola batsensis]EAQ01135.1 hypothetical protein OB2597_14294 [Pseudooceanicola batsensis HTCC2597]